MVGLYVIDDCDLLEGGGESIQMNICMNGFKLKWGCCYLKEKKDEG